MNSTVINVLVGVVGFYFIFKKQIDPLLKKLFTEAQSVGLPVENDLKENQHHFKQSCNLDNEPINAAMAVAKALPEGAERTEFIDKTVPVIFKESLKNG